MLGKKILSSATTEETEQIGRALAEELLQSGKKSAFIALYGDLGVGKTAFTRGFVSAICPAARVKSPTYTVVNEYRGGILPVFHFDMYRIENEDQLYNIGFYDYLDYDGVLAIEWSENIAGFFDDEHITVAFEKLGDTDRKITISGVD